MVKVFDNVFSPAIVCAPVVIIPLLVVVAVGIAAAVLSTPNTVTFKVGPDEVPSVQVTEGETETNYGAAAPLPIKAVLAPPAAVFVKPVVVLAYKTPH